MNGPLEMPLAASPTGEADMRQTIADLYRGVPTRRDPENADELMALLRLLYRVARRDLPLARLFEGHVDALQIIARYGDREQAEAAARIAAGGGAFGVWNAALPDEPLRVADGRLIGGKSFASGAGILTHALASADTDSGNRLVLIDLHTSDPEVDRSWWQVVGMQRSQTHRVRWAGADQSSFAFIGAVGDYAREPFFSGGALRFVACHAGGVAAVFDHVRDHLASTRRADDPHQAVRLTDLYVAAQSAAAWVRAAAGTLGDRYHVEHVASARVAVAGLAEQAITIAQQAVGAQGMFVSHPLSAMLTDLMVYLRQPAPDAQRVRVGRATAEAWLAPDL